MKHDWQTYLILLAVFVLSFLGALVFREEPWLSAVSASPGIVAMLAALFQLMRDQATYEKQLRLQENQMRFTLGAASHMANMAFDKHAEFCERYLAEVHETAVTLITEGDTVKALDHAGNLHSIRRDYGAWLTSNIDEELFQFERKLSELGANAGYIKSTNGSSGETKNRTKLIWKNHEILLDILDAKEGEEKDRQSVERTKLKIRKILGVEELAKLRETLVSEAASALGETLNKKPRPTANAPAEQSVK